MEIYHTETQADYDALMVELERQRIETLEKRYWKEHDNQTVVFVRAIGRYIDNRTDTTYGSLALALKKYPTVPITKYKAKVDERVRFTKENVGKILDEWFTENTHLSAEGIIANIEELDDTPKKVGVPKYIAEFYERVKHCELYDVFEKFEASDGIISEWYFNQNQSGRHNSPVANAQEVIAKMHLYGYTIEPEKLYYISLPHLETSDGIQQVLSQRKGDKNYFASRPAETLKQRFTKEELERVPEIYKPYAKPVEEEAE